MGVHCVSLSIVKPDIYIVFYSESESLLRRSGIGCGNNVCYNVYFLFFIITFKF